MVTVCMMNMHLEVFVSYLVFSILNVIFCEHMTLVPLIHVSMRIFVNTTLVPPFSLVWRLPRFAPIKFQQCYTLLSNIPVLQYNAITQHYVRTPWLHIHQIKDKQSLHRKSYKVTRLHLIVYLYYILNINIITPNMVMDLHDSELMQLKVVFQLPLCTRLQMS